MTAGERTIRVDEFLAHPPARVWHALTDPAMLARWLMPNDFQPVVGHRFTFRTHPRPNSGFDGVVHCEVLALEPQRLLRISWRGGSLDTTVTRP
ncbi:MAG: SRPBCC domain-containing protein [Actinoallomurus sp.]